MAEVTLTINGRNYGITCDDGQEQRVTDLGHYVDARFKDISSAGAASNETHLLVLTAIMLADEVFDLRDGAASNNNQVNVSAISEEEDAAVAQAIDQLAGRIDAVAGRITQKS